MGALCNHTPQDSVHSSKMRFIVLAAALLGAALASEELEAWNSYKATYGKTYESAAEDALRMKIFQDTVAKINAHNELFKAGKVHFEQGVNHFSDLTASEYRYMNNGFQMPENLTGKAFVAPNDEAVPESIDWRQYGAVTPVKNQGQCGSCWAFSSTGSLEGQWFRKTQKLVSLSEQNLVDCCTPYGNYGCRGGWQENAFKYIKANGGIDTEASYPYYAVQYACRYNSAYDAAQVTGYVDVTRNDENALKQAVGTIGPISIAIDATRPSFQSYKSGVYYDAYCSSVNLDHAVLVVGYGHDASSNLDYWIVKNSWGTWWGTQGYIKMIRNYNNNCGVASHPTYPTV